MAGERTAREWNGTMRPSAPGLPERLQRSTESARHSLVDGVQLHQARARGQRPAYVAVREAFRKLGWPLR
jgi:hypothetical protein